MNSSPTGPSVAGPKPPPEPSASATPPETLEGWYALHQIFSINRDVARSVTKTQGEIAGNFPTSTSSVSNADATNVSPHNGGWTALVQLIGSSADVMVVHFRSTIDEIGEAQRAFATLPSARALIPVYSFLSVTEAGLYHLTAELSRNATARGGAVGDAAYSAELAQRVEVERASAHVQRRLYPTIPEGMPYVCFYPMSKRRSVGQNWYALTLDERSRLMHAHGMVGRRYSGRILQIISGAIGLDAWEWGVTLFAKDPLDFKKLVTDMRFDETSAQYAEFGSFYVGRLSSGGDVASLIETIVG